MADGRNHLRATPPAQVKGSTSVTTQLTREQYRKLYDMAAVAGVSMAQAVRNLIDRHSGASQ